MYKFNLKSFHKNLEKDYLNLSHILTSDITPFKFDQIIRNSDDLLRILKILPKPDFLYRYFETEVIFNRMNKRYIRGNVGLFESMVRRAIFKYFGMEWEDYEYEMDKVKKKRRTPIFGDLRKLFSIFPGRRFYVNDLDTGELVEIGTIKEVITVNTPLLTRYEKSSERTDFRPNNYPMFNLLITELTGKGSKYIRVTPFGIIYISYDLFRYKISGDRVTVDVNKELIDQESYNIKLKEHDKINK